MVHTPFMRYFIILMMGVLLSGMVAVPVTAAEDLRPIFYQANQYYEAGDFAKAIETYQSLLNAGQTSGNLYYNLGNAYYRAGQKGQALVNYLRARLWIPRDPDVRANLEHVRSDLQLTDEGGGWIHLFATGIGDLVSLREMLWIVSFIFSIAAVVILAHLFWPRRRSRLRIPLIAALVLLGIAVMGAAFSAIDNSKPTAVVVAKEAVVRFEPSASGSAYFTLKEGNCATIDTIREGWMLLHRSDGKKGWVQAGDVEPMHAARNQ